MDGEQEVIYQVFYGEAATQRAADFLTGLTLNYRIEHFQIVRLPWGGVAVFALVSELPRE